MIIILKKFTLTLFTFLFIFAGNSSAENLTSDESLKGKLIEDFRNEGYITTNSQFVVEGNGMKYFYVVLERKPTFSQNKVTGQILKQRTSSIVICKYNLTNTFCRRP